MATKEFLIFTDIHIHPHKRSEQRLRDCLEVLEWVFITAKKLGIKNILFGGDFFHDRNKIDLLTCHETFVILQKYLDGNINLHMVLGNHDLWYYEKSTVSSVTMLSSLPNVRVYNIPTAIIIDGINWHMIPFTHNPIKDIEFLSERVVGETFLLGHIAVNGARLNSAGSVAEVEIEHDGEMIKVEKDLFKKYTHVFLGHYHGYQELTNNLEYVGTPLQLNFGEANEKKHILHLVIDGSNITKNYIENEFSPRHYTGNLEQLKNIDKKHIDKAFVSLVTQDDNKEILNSQIKELSDLGLKNVKIKPTQSILDADNKSAVVQTSKNILENIETMVEEYVKHLNPELDHQTLIDLGRRIVNSSIDEGE